MDVINFEGRRQEAAAKTLPGKYEIHLYPQAEGEKSEVQVAEGFLKFAPMFIAVTDSADEPSSMLLGVASQIVKMIKKVDETAEKYAEASEA